MYVPNKCSKCGQIDYQNLHFEIIEEIRKGKSTFTVDDITVRDTVSHEELAQAIVTELRPFMHDGMTTDEFCKLLKKYFGVASRYCCDLIQRMKIELDMYCPDRQHLYFVSQ